MPGSAASQPSRFCNSTTGRSRDSSSARSASSISASCATDTALANITAKGFSSRFLRLAQARHGFGIARVAGQVIAAEAFDGDDLAAQQARQGFGDRVARLVTQRELRPAYGTGVRLGVEAAVVGLVVLALAGRAHLEGRHAGVRPVVGQIARQRVARPAMRAVDEGVAPAAVGGIEQLGEAVGTSDGIRRHRRVRRPAQTDFYFEAARAGGGCFVCLDGSDAGQRRRIRLQSGEEDAQRFRRTLGLDVHPLAVVAHPAGELQFLRQPKDEGPEADALHLPAHADAAADGGRGADGNGHVSSSPQRTPCSSQASHSSMPSPLFAETCSTAIFGLTRRAYSMHFATSNVRCGSRSVLVSSIRSLAANMFGYLSGLSSPSVTERITTLCASPRSNSAGQTRLPTFSISSRPPCVQVEPLEGVADHVRVEVAALAGVHLDGLRAGGADALGVVAGLLVALDHRQRMAAGELADGLDQQRGLARAGAGDEVDGEQAARLPFLAVGAGVAVVLGEDVLLDLHHAARREARRVGVFMSVMVARRS
jgi:hypothetical protein